jgi:hypothetical protein
LKNTKNLKRRNSKNEIKPGRMKEGVQIRKIKEREAEQKLYYILQYEPEATTLIHLSRTAWPE